MDESKPSISPHDLYARLGTAVAPIVVDVRHPSAFASADRLIIGAVYRPPDQVERWRTLCRPAVPWSLIASMGTTSARAWSPRCVPRHRRAISLDGGIAAWTGRRSCHPPQDRSDARQMGDARAAEDRSHRLSVADRAVHRSDRRSSSTCRRSQVVAVARQTGGTPYDIDGVEFSHEGERCSFDTFLRIYDISDPALDHLAQIVRGADTSRHDLTPQCGGLFAISLGLSANFADDHQMLEHGMVIYDALYTWCRSLQDETPQLARRAKPSGAARCDEAVTTADELSGVAPSNHDSAARPATPH